MSALKSNILSVSAEGIRRLLLESDALALESIDKAIEAGRQLCLAKEECAHGEWLPFLKRADVPERKAQRYMKLARAGIKSDTVSDLGGIKAALGFLSNMEEDDCPFLLGMDAPTSVEEIDVQHAPLPKSYVRAERALRAVPLQIESAGLCKSGWV
jgi:hypothetical protein